MITKEELLGKYNISDELLESAEISWDELCEIYEDFCNYKYDRYRKIKEEFIDTYLKDILEDKEIAKTIKIHSIRSRVKDAEHLIVKIIRKKQTNQKKYRNIDKYNYEKFITDLVGIRCLVLFKDDWENFHHYILSKFENNVEYYIKDPVQSFDLDESHYYIAEQPKVHIRNGDSRENYEKILPPDSVIDNKVYRSVHYIIKYKGIYLEIQVRTIFEEGWGEIDHAIVYPYYQDDAILNEYTELLNRLSGLADEMGSFFHKLKTLEIQYISQISADTVRTVENEQKKNKFIEPKVNKMQKGETFSDSTPYSCLQAVLGE